MEDLENMLLQAAGRNVESARKNQSRPRAKWQREGSDSEGSDSRDDDSDNPRAGNRRASGSQVPLKKRFDPPEKDRRKRSYEDDDDDDDGDEDDDDKQSDDGSDGEPSYGSDLYKDAADKEVLANMSELNREMILAQRSEELDDKKLRQKAIASSSKVEKSRKEPPPPLPFRNRPSLRSDKTASKKTVALNELRAKRMKQQDPEFYHATGGDGGAGFGARDSSPSNNRSAPDEIPSDSGEDGNRSDHGEDDIPMENIKGDDVDDKPLKFEDVQAITIRRSKLAKWFMEPFFEDLIVGCFVRVGIGKSRSGIATYRLCLVKNVDATDPDRQYKLEGWTTHKYLNCIWGNETSAARWQMAMVSDSLPLEEEFKEWVREVERSSGRMLSWKDVDEKKKAIQKINNYVYSAATVKQMLQEKKSASSRPINVAAEKDRLRKEMEVAEHRGDDAEMERIRGRLKELDMARQQDKEKNTKAVRLAEMNRKNRAENFKNASEMKPVNTSLKAGEVGYDPFSRRWTRSMNYYISKPGGDGNGAAAVGNNGDAPVIPIDAIGLGPVNGVEAGLEATAAALEAAADAGKLVDTNAPVDQGTESNSLHNFDLPISLSKFEGIRGLVLGFLARKQKIEAKVGYKVPDNDGRRHALTLTVSDYKRRRGLL